MTSTVNVKPVGPDQTHGVTLAGGNPPFSDTVTDASDGTYASFAPGATALSRNGGASIPAGALITGVVLNARLHSASPPTAVIVTLGTVSYKFAAPPSGAFTTLSSSALTNFGKVTDPDYFNAGSYIAFKVSGGTLLIAEASVDITYVPIPVVTALGPTGTIAVTQPIVQFAVASDFPTSRFQIKIFSSAQVAATGFDPDGSAALYDSGVLLGSVGIFQPPFNLPNGDTYTTYIRAAQQVGSITQWSDWDSITCTVSVTPPATPIVFVQPDNANARVKILAGQISTPAWDHVTIQRTTDGATWTDVRSATRAPTHGTQFLFFDYETGNEQTAWYRAMAINATADGDIASDWSAPSTAVMWKSNATWLKSVTFPPLNAQVVINGIPTMKRRLPRGTFDVAGRSDPVAVSDVRHLVEGTVTFATLELEDLEALQALLDRGETLLLQTPPSHRFSSRYLSFGDEDENRQSPQAEQDERYVVLPFQEVVAPEGELITFGATWGDVEAAYATWSDAQAANSSWAQLLVRQAP